MRARRQFRPLTSRSGRASHHAFARSLPLAPHTPERSVAILHRRVKRRPSSLPVGVIAVHLPWFRDKPAQSPSVRMDVPCSCSHRQPGGGHMNETVEDGVGQRGIVRFKVGTPSSATAATGRQSRGGLSDRRAQRPKRSSRISRCAPAGSGGRGPARIIDGRQALPLVRVCEDPLLAPRCGRPPVDRGRASNGRWPSTMGDSSSSSVSTIFRGTRWY